MNKVNINISLDKQMFNKAMKILNEVGLNLSTLVNSTLKRLIKDRDELLDVLFQEPNKETIKALEECKEMEKHPEKYRVYTDLDELIKDLEKD